MNALITRFVLSVIVAIVVAILLIVLGTLLIAVKEDIATTIGDLCKAFAVPIGILAGLWYFFTNGGLAA